MNLFLWSALTLGFFGSFHCAGMCGPIAMALPNRDQQMTSLFVSLLGRLLKTDRKKHDSMALEYTRKYASG